jgi:O-antigen/teichoic acid export membrane protein
VPFSLTQGLGRTDVTGKIHLAELVPYMACLLLLVTLWGVTGAAIAWVLRAVVDFGLLVRASVRFRALRQGVLRRQMIQTCLLATCLVSLTIPMPPAWEHVAMAVACLVAIGLSVTLQRHIYPASEPVIREIVVSTDVLR